MLMPKNKKELRDWDRRSSQRKWIRRLISWPIIIACGFALDYAVVYQLQLTEQSTKLLVGFGVGAMTAEVLRAIE